MTLPPGAKAAASCSIAWSVASVVLMSGPTYNEGRVVATHPSLLCIAETIVLYI
jgi:hypothetical protein